MKNTYKVIKLLCLTQYVTPLHCTGCCGHWELIGPNFLMSITENESILEIENDQSEAGFEGANQLMKAEDTHHFQLKISFNTKDVC